MKSSAQRQIRAKLLEQIPFLSQPAALPSTSSSTAVAAQPAPTAPQSDDEDDEDSGKKKGKGGKKGKGAGPGGKGGKKGKKHDVEDEPAAGAAEEGAAPAVDEELTVLDLIWPKKETLSLIKWCVRAVVPLSNAPVLTVVPSRAAENTSRSMPSTASPSSSSISTARSTRLSGSCIAVRARVDLPSLGSWSLTMYRLAQSPTCSPE